MFLLCCLGLFGLLCLLVAGFQLLLYFVFVCVFSLRFERLLTGVLGLVWVCCFELLLCV